jgi:hypothetical protein
MAAVSSTESSKLLPSSAPSPSSASSARAEPAADPVATVMGLALSYLVSRSLHVAAELGVADLLAEGPRSVHELAETTGARADALRRLLRCLAAHGVFRSVGTDRFELSPAAQLLRTGAMRDGVLLCGEVTGDGSWWNAVGALGASARSGEPAFDRQHGMGFFDYMACHPECGAWFDRGLANFAAAENPAVAAAITLPRGAQVVDVGGGQGGLLAELLHRQADLRATLFDLPAVVAHPDHLSRHGTLAGRWQAVAGDFFEAVPSGADAYLLKRILHDWDDEACVRVLSQCRRAMAPQGRVFVADAVLPDDDAFHPGKVMDILMMVFGPGKERTRAEFEALLARAGLRIASVTPTATPVAVIEAVAA